MEDFEGLEPTGREIKGPIETLVEYTHSGGLKRCAIVFDPQFRDRPELGFDIQSVLGFLQNPDVCNLLEVTELDKRPGAFAYPTGTCWTVAELLEGLAGVGKKAGVRAGLELCYLAANILHDASKVAPDAGIFCHGNLNPWRLVVKVDGQVQIIGYGLPQIDVLVHREEDGSIPSEDGLRYCSPERLEGNPEDVYGDILSLVLVAFELITGEPLYNGLAKEIHQQAINGQGPYRLYQYRDVLPESVIELFSRALKYDPDSRYVDANEFVWAVKDVMGLPEIDGMSLAEVVQTVRQANAQGGAIIGGKTNSMSKAELKAMRELLDAPNERPLPPPTEGRPDEVVIEEEAPRWGRVDRELVSDNHAVDEPEIVLEDDDISFSGETPPPDRRDALRARLRQSKEDRRQSLKDRLKSERKSRTLTQSQKKEAVVPVSEDLGDSSVELDEPVEETVSTEELVESDVQPVDDTAEVAVEDVQENEESVLESEDKSEEIEEPLDENIPEAEEEALSEKPIDAAAALLARLRGSQDLRASQAKSTVETPSVPTEIFNQGEDDVPRAVPQVETLPVRAKPMQPTNLSASGVERAVFQVCLEGHAPRPVKLKLGDPTCESASRLGQALGGVPADLSGRITGWYRIRQGGKWVDGASLTGALDPSEVVEIVRVRGELVHMTIETSGIEVNHRFQAPVATSVPSSYLLGHLMGWLGLPAGEWKMRIDGHDMLPMQTLSEFELSAHSTLVVAT